VALIDGVVTHNFINQEVVACFRLKFEESTRFKVVVADGYSLAYK